MKSEGGILGAIYVIYADLAISATIIILLLPAPLLVIDRITSPAEVQARLTASSSVSHEKFHYDYSALIREFYGSPVILLKHNPTFASLQNREFAKLNLQFYGVKEIDGFQDLTISTRGYQTDYWALSSAPPSIGSMYGFYKRVWDDDIILGSTIKECVLEDIYENRAQRQKIPRGYSTRSDELGFLSPVFLSGKPVYKGEAVLNDKTHNRHHPSFPWVEYPTSTLEFYTQQVNCNKFVVSWIVQEFSDRLKSDGELFAETLSEDTALNVKLLSNSGWSEQNMEGFSSLLEVEFDWRDYDKSLLSNYLGVLEHISFFNPRMVDVLQLKNYSTNTNDIRIKQLDKKDFKLTSSCIDSKGKLQVESSENVDTLIKHLESCYYGIAQFNRITYHIKRGTLSQNKDFTSIPLFPIGLSGLFMTFVTYSLVSFTKGYIAIYSSFRSSLFVKSRQVDRYFFLGYVLAIFSIINLGLGLNF